MAYTILIGLVVAVVLIAVVVAGRSRSRSQDDLTSRATPVPDPEQAERAGPDQAPPGSRPDREAHGKP